MYSVSWAGELVCQGNDSANIASPFLEQHGFSKVGRKIYYYLLPTFLKPFLNESFFEKQNREKPCPWVRKTVLDELNAVLDEELKP